MIFIAYRNIIEKSRAGSEYVCQVKYTFDIRSYALCISVMLSMMLYYVNMQSNESMKIKLSSLTEMAWQIANATIEVSDH